MGVLTKLPTMSGDDLGKIYGVKSVTIEHDVTDLAIKSDEIPYLSIPSGTKVNLELELDGKEIGRLKEALNSIPRTAAEQERHDIETMQEVLKCRGYNVADKVTNYLAKKDEEVKNKVDGQKNSKKKLSRYQIKHR